MTKAGKQMIAGLKEAVTIKSLLDENDALRAENEKLRKALEPFADEAECYTDDVLDCFPVGYHTVVENLRTALKILEGE